MVNIRAFQRLHTGTALRKYKLASGTETIPRLLVDYRAIRPVSEDNAIKVRIEDRVQNLVGQVGELHWLANA